MTNPDTKARGRMWGEKNETEKNKIVNRLEAVPVIGKLEMLPFESERTIQAEK